MAKILSGKDVAAALQKNLSQRVEKLKEKNITPTLAIVRVGEKDSDIAYERGATKKSASLGIDVRNVILPADVAEETLIGAIKELNEDSSVHGVLLFRPLPEHLNYDRVCNSLIPEKDVDAMTTINSGLVYDGSADGFPPCTAQAVMEILDYYDIEVKGAKIALIGWGAVVGKPLSVLLLTRFATLTVCHIFTKDVSTPCKDAEIIISAAGKANLVGEKHLAPGQIVIDVGINADPKDPSKIVGDVDFAYAEDLVESITPVPGGVGSVTTSVLAKHVIMAAEKTAK
ncbi:MAG: bifunctional 5,10-methylenetetrahydrofolate dehydrogenase/5,10-methenyltetrahydrofolate cyclohydrolase [Bacillota bacterium]|nr:bifunctional 5,10-methylenetetrahydrofolate dehydrogenase/5,10-methenyltetrahydrofolate cyclohydrolase [Bacillota bacterium]